MPWYLMTHWSMGNIIDISPNSERYEDWSVLLPGISCVSYIRHFTLLLASMMRVAVPLLFLKEPSLIPVALPVIIDCTNTNPWSVHHILLIAQWSSIGNKKFRIVNYISRLLSGLRLVGIVEWCYFVIYKTNRNKHRPLWWPSEEFYKILGSQWSYLHYILNRD